MSVEEDKIEHQRWRLGELLTSHIKYGSLYKEAAGILPWALLKEYWVKCWLLFREASLVRSSFSAKIEVVIRIRSEISNLHFDALLKTRGVLSKACEHVLRQSLNATFNPMYPDRTRVSVTNVYIIRDGVQGDIDLSILMLGG